MDATLTVLSSFVAGVVAHAIWQAHRGASDMQQQQRRRGQASDEGGEGRDAAALSDRTGEHESPLVLPPSPALPPLLTPSSFSPGLPPASLSTPTSVHLTHTYLPAPSPPYSGSHVHSPGCLLTPPPEQWVAQPEKTLEKVGATDSWGEAVDHIEGEEGEHI